MVSSNAIVTSGELAKPPTNVPSYTRATKFKYEKLLLGLGIVEVIFGICIVALCVASQLHASPPPFWYEPKPTYVIVGMACGIFPIICGSVGIHLKRDPSRCMRIVNMWFSTFAMLAAIVLLIFTSMAEPEWFRSLFIIHWVVFVESFLLLCITFAHFIYTFTPVCCCEESPEEEEEPALKSVESIAYMDLSNNKDAQLENPQFYALQIEAMVGKAY